HHMRSKKYCRITLGTLYHPRFLIHDDFFCIIFVRQQDLIKCDPPFLNRFEKHIIDIESLIHSCHLMKHLFVDFNPDYITNLVMNAFDYLKISEYDNDNQKDVTIQYCKQKLIRTSSFDFPLHLSCKINDNGNIQNLIEQYYNIHKNLSFSDLINQALNQSITSKQIVYIFNFIIYL
ncbi:unnamed protein product, partial [Rotaria sp. Silwood2]